MIANFFQSLNVSGTQYLLISGQATVLYGAATFSEDIDLWINPTEEDRERFMAAPPVQRPTPVAFCGAMGKADLARAHPIR